MTKLSKKTLNYARDLVSKFNTRPLGAIVVSDPENTASFSLTITSTTIAVSNSEVTYSSSYVGKNLRQVVTELNTSSLPLEIRAIADISSLKAGDLIASGSTIPDGFHQKDRTTDGSGAIVRVKRWAVKYKERKSISLLSPIDSAATLPWYARITEGEFTQKVNGITYTFSTPEYSKQVWSDKYGRPFKNVSSEPVKFLTTSSIQLKNFPVYNKNNIVLGTDEKLYPSSVIKDIDEQNGIVYLHPGTTIPGDVLAYYTYIDKSFSYKGLNLNGHFQQNPYILDKYIIYYLRPVSSSTGISRAESVFHVVAESVEEAINFIPEASPGEPITVIGAISIRAYQDIKDIGIVDTRSYGGGLTNDALGKATEKKFPRSQYFLDIGRKEGIPYPGAAAIIVDLPPELKETLTVDEIKRRANKFIAAGIYPVFNFKEEEYSSQFVAIDGNADISFVEDSIVGSTITPTEPAYWSASELIPPVPLDQTGYSAIDLTINAVVSSGEGENFIQIPANSVYSQKYIKSSADAVFSWEERPYKGTWERKTFRDDRTVPSKHIVGGRLTLDATLGYKEVRRVQSFSPFIYNESDFYDSLVIESTKIVNSIVNVGEKGSTVAPFYVNGTINDIIAGDITTVSGVNPGFIKNSIGSYIENYESLTGLNILGGNNILDGVAKYAFDCTTTRNSTTGDFAAIYNSSWNSYLEYANESYNICDDIFYFSTASKHLIGLQGATSKSTLIAQTGALQLFKKFINVTSQTGVWSGVGSDITSPFVNAFSGVGIPLPVTSNAGEIDEALNQDFEEGRYVKAAASLYSSLTLPLSGSATAEAGYASGLFTDLDINPLTYALSGIGHRFYGFEDHIAPYSGSIAMPNTWITSYNRVSKFASNILCDTSIALDDLIEGNNDWAGLTNTGNKNATYYTDNSFSGAAYQYDTYGQTGSIVVVGDNITESAVSISPYQYAAVLIKRHYESMRSINSWVISASEKGALMEQGMGKLIANYLWLPTHNANEDTLFTAATNSWLVNDVFSLGSSLDPVDLNLLVGTFETAGRSFIKSAVDENGIISEAAAFDWDRAPYYGGIPDEIFGICSAAVKYYTASSNTAKRSEWISIAEGLFNNTTGEYSKEYGYPHDTVVGVSSVSGNIGGNQLGAYIDLLCNKSTPYTDDEALALTGALSGNPSSEAHIWNFADNIPETLVMMDYENWLGIPSYDTYTTGDNSAGEDGSYGLWEVSKAKATLANSGWSALDSTTYPFNDYGSHFPVVCATGSQPFTGERHIASRFRPLNGIYSSSVVGAESEARWDLNMSLLRTDSNPNGRVDLAVKSVGSLAFENQEDNIQRLGFENSISRCESLGLTNCMTFRYHPTTLWIFTQGLTRDEIIAQHYVDLAYYINLLKSSPSAYRVNGRLLVGWYINEDVTMTVEETRALFDATRIDTSEDFYTYTTWKDTDWFGCCDIISPWVDIPKYNSATGATEAIKSEAWTIAKHEGYLDAMSYYPGRAVFANILPGFDDWTKQWGDGVERVIPRSTGLIQGQFSGAASLRNSGKPVAGIHLLTWDDWAEGTQWEPTTTEGVVYIDRMTTEIANYYGEAISTGDTAAFTDVFNNYGKLRDCPI